MQSAAQKIRYVAIDLFAGAGGVSEGMKRAGIPCLIAINHDPMAIASHKANHANTEHFIEDIRKVSLQSIKDIMQAEKKEHPNTRFILWASAECTNHSNAKGGQSRDIGSRTLPMDLVRYVSFLDFDYVFVENVREFITWGDLHAKTTEIETEYGKTEVCKIYFNKSSQKIEALCWIANDKKKGNDYVNWTKKMCEAGNYDYDFKILNCADFGDPTKRMRYFGIFAKKGLPIRFPNPTHTNPEKVKVQSSMYNNLNKWKPIRDCLDFSKLGQSLFDRKKPLVENSLQRILAGVIRYMGNKDTMNQIDSILSQIKGDCFLSLNTSAIYTKSNIVTTKGLKGGNSANVETNLLVKTAISNAFITSYYSSPTFAAAMSKCNSIDLPAPSLTTVPHEYVVCIDKYYGISTATGADLPASTLTTVDRMAIISCSKFKIGVNNGNLYFINGQPHILIEANDSPYTKKLKIAMCILGISDIYHRMLMVNEMKLIHSFPQNYVLLGTEKQQKAFIGNSVPCNTVASVLGFLNK